MSLVFAWGRDGLDEGHDGLSYPRNRPSKVQHRRSWLVFRIDKLWWYQVSLCLGPLLSGMVTPSVLVLSAPLSVHLRNELVRLNSYHNMFLGCAQAHPAPQHVHIICMKLV